MVKIHDSIYDNTPAYKQLHADIGRLVDGFGKGLKILEAPTMTGRLAHLLQQNHDVTTMDISEEALRAAREKSENIKTVVFNAYAMIPFSAGAFDGITSTHLLYFLSNKDNIISKYHRVLKPHGFLIITEFNGYLRLVQTLKTSGGHKGIFAWKLSDIIFNLFNQISPKQYLTKESLTALLAKHHFRIDNCHKSFGNLSNIILAQKNSEA